MIELRQIRKSYRTREGSHEVLRGVDLTVQRGERLAIVGRNGSGKSTLIRLLSGAERPTSGTIDARMRVSWPLAFGGAFQGSLTGLDNFKFICRIHGVPQEERLDFVERFAELGRYLREPVKTYSSGMRARLAFAVSMAIDFDCFLIDEVIAVGDARFHEKCEEELFARRADRAMVMVSHDGASIVRRCATAAVLHDGVLRRFQDVGEALHFHDRVLSA